MKIVSIQGPWSVGKSTLINSLQNKSGLSISTMKEFGDEQRSERDKKNFDLSIKEDFLENQEIFFKGEQRRHQMIKKLKVDYLVLDRGPEDTLCFTQIHPKAIGKDWDISKDLKKLKEKYITYESDLIIYLYADLKVIRERKKKDSIKRRRNFDKYLDLYYDLEKEYFAQNKKTVFIDTTNKSAEEVYQIVLQLVK